MAAPGDQFGPYRIVRQVGRGGMGVVHEAVEADEGDGGRRVALKVASPEYAADPGFRARFAREARAQAGLDSPHVLPVVAHGEIDGWPYIASPFLPDGDLGGWMRRHGPPSPEVGVALVAQVASGLAAAHAHGVVHRDLKPGNVLVRMDEGEPTAYLTDFGIARLARAEQSLTGHGVVPGTPSYMAPELHDGAVADERSDVYALGCLLWATLTGRPPYPDGTDYQRVRAHRTAPVPQVVAGGRYARGLNRILRRAMAKDPVGRHRSATQFRDDLLRLARGRAPVGVVPAPAAVRRVRRTPPVRRPRARWTTAAAAAVVAVVAAVLVFGIVRAGPQPDPVARADELTTRERTVADAIAVVLAHEDDIDRPVADCMGVEIVRQLGVARMIDAGLVHEDLTIDVAAEARQEIRSDVVAAARRCAD